jgi:hypothetical protein
MGSVETQSYTRVSTSYGNGVSMGSPGTPGRANNNLLLKLFSQL